MAETARRNLQRRQSIVSRAFGILLAGFAVALINWAQQTPPPSRSFAVASVEPGDPESREFAFLAGSRHFAGTNQTRKTLIGYAWDSARAPVLNSGRPNRLIFSHGKDES